ncbi:MAG TPA: flagellar biosynthesis protein FliP [Ignavibacteria bacterium]|nr:flagellar biosynthesis protein FliP [Ignavibacteria bacterium]
MKKAVILLILILILFSPTLLLAQTSAPLSLPKIGISIGPSNNPGDVSTTLQILLLITVLSLAPALLIMTTSYLRIIIVFHFLRSALGTQQMPPNQLIAGITLFITFFVMAPTWNTVNEQALKPLMNKKITAEQAYDKGIVPIREFMFRNVRNEDLKLFIGMANLSRPNESKDIPTYVVIPAFVLSELRAGFIIGFFLFIPFIMIDMIIASILLSMGMLMLPPTLISLPFKILLFILVDGWNLIIGSVVRGFS